MSKRSWFYAFISALFCSAAVALQPTVRAGSISLGGSAKPVTPSVTPTSTQSSSVSSANRGAAVSKFSQGTIVPVSTSASNNNNVSSSLIEELKQRIAELELARTALEGRQDSLESSQSQTDNAIDSVTAQVQSISSTNSDLNDAVSTLQSNSTTLQSTLNSIQQQANSLSDSLNTNIDSRLQYRGLLDSSNNIAFVTKNDITAEKLATKIATNPGAAETLSRSITPTVVSADSVTTALNDSETFKDMVSRAATEKGFAKTTALETNTARIADLESTTGSLQVKVDGDVDTQGSLLYAIKNDDTIRDALKGDPGENGTSVDVDDVVNALKNDAKFIGDTKGRDAKTTWYEYCIKGDNLTAIIQQVYPEVGDCESFTNEQFTELTNGARSKCLSWALTPEELSTDEGIGKKLVKIFGSGILNNLTSYHAGTRIVLPNSSVAVNFVIACEKKYDEIMAGDDAKSVEQKYCEAQADNYPNGVTNLDLIKKLYTNVNSCDDFTIEMYTNITSGAKAYCKSLAQNPEDLSADSGIGLRLEQTFGAGIVETLKFSKLDTAVNVNGTRAAKNFVEACVENFDAIMAGKDAKSVEQVYCEAQAENYNEGITNLTIIQKLYSTVRTCDDFTPEMYTAITSGAKGYCKSLAQKPEDLSADSGIGLKLEKTFGTGIVASLKTNKLDTVVSINGAKAPKNFVEACEENYDAIMAGKDAKSVEQLYCEAQADNYPEGTTNLTIIQKLYSTVSTCDDFTPEMYTAITSGAKGYCKSLAQKPEDLSADSGIGLKLEKTFGTGIVASLKTNKLDTVVSINGAKAPKNFVEACVENYDEIMAGKDAKSVEQVYCEAQADNYPAGTTNLAAIITKLYPLVTSCDEFTIEMYTNLTSGATAYCKSLALNPNDLTAGTGIGKRLTQLFGESIIQDLQRDGLDTSIAPKGAKAAKKFVELCVENYDAIMAGKDAKSIEQAYCESRAENYDENTTNLTIIQKFYPSVTNCDMFTAEMYTAITSGAKGYCLSLAKKPEDLNSGTGIGAKLVKIFGNTVIEDLQAHGLETNVFIDGAKGAKTFLEACEENYDAIMTGKDAEPIEMIYCHAQAENYPEGTTNEDLIKKLYPIDDCSEFTYEMYTAITTGAKAYCKSLAQKPASLSADEGIGKKLAETFGSGIISNLKTNKLDARVTIAVKSNSMEKSSTNVEMSFVEACEKKYDEIMSGKNAKSVEQTYCENDDNLTKIITPLFGITDCADFDSSKYQAIVGGAKAYCLSLATEPEKLTEDNTMTKKLKKVFGSDIISKLTTNGAGAIVQSTKNGAKAAEDVKFVDECAARYDEIMGILPIETEFCESEDRLEKIIKPLYGNDKTCENFTNAEYQAIMGGAKAYCLSLVNDAKNNKLDANIGIGAKLEKILGTGIINQVKTGGAATPVTITKNGAKAATDTNFVLACEEKYNEIVAGDDALGFTYRDKVATYNDLPETCEQGDGYQVEDADQITDWQGLLYICNCHTVDNVQSCSFPDRGKGVKFQGPKGEDGKSPEQTYCETNFTTVNALYSSIENVNECNEFTAEQYKAMMEGAKTYCLFIAQDFISGNLEINKGIGKKLDKELKLYGTEDGIFTLKERKAPITLSEMLQTQKFNNNQSFLDACEEKYNQIMSGDDGKDAKSVEQTYCEAAYEKDNTTTNLEAIIKPLYGNAMTCETFTAEQYNAIMGGAKAYCLSLAADPAKLTNDNAITKKLKKTFGDSIVATLTEGGIGTTITRTTKAGDSTVKFVDECARRYDEIMSGDDGKDAKSAEQTYCETNFATVSALYSGIATESDCANFTAEQYKAMMEGAKAYCLLLAQDFANNKLSSTTGIGKKMNERLKIGTTDNGIFSMETKTLANVLSANTKFNGTSDTFLTACEKNYNEIMSGEKGADGEDAVKTWCRAHTLNGAKSGGTVTKTLSAAKLVAAFKASGNTDTQIEKSQDNTTGEVTGYFKTLEACIAAVNEDPTIMSGESAAETQYNEDVKKEKKEGNTNFTLGSNTVTTFETKKNTFGSKMVTADNIGSKLTGNTVKNALQNAGFATKTEVTNDVNDSVFTLSDFSRLLSGGGLKVDAAGTVKLADTTKNTDAANIVQKMETAKAKGGSNSSIKLTGLAATSNIATSVATVAAASAANSGSLDNSIDCNKQDYMFWNSYGGDYKDGSYTGACEKCPDGTDFKNPEGITAAERCACPEPTQKLVHTRENQEDPESPEIWQCVEAGEENDCLAQDGTFWGDNKCGICPKGTYFNEESLKPGHTEDPRCICEDKSKTFNPNMVTDEFNGCSATGANECATQEMFWFQQPDGSEGHCEACPDHAPFDPDFGSCKCKDGDEFIFNPYEQTCRTCDDSGYEYDVATHLCKCEENTHFDMVEWKCIENGK